jgi:hypothetical protein
MQRNERRLLIAAAAIASVFAVMLTAQKLIHWQKNLDRREREIELLQMEAEALLADAPEWEARARWLTQTQPVASDELEANKELDHIVALAKREGLVVQSQQLQEPMKTDFFLQIGVNLTVKGRVPAVFRWMHTLLAPTEFRFVPALKINPDKDDPAQVVAQVQFWRRYSPSLAASASP